MAKRRPFGSIVQRDNRPGFSIRFPYHGRNVWRNGGPTKKDARLKLNRVQALLQDGRTLATIDAEVFGRTQALEVRENELTFQAAAAAYLTYAEERKKPSTFAVDRYRMRAICRTKWAQLPLAEITPSILESWCSSRKSSGISGPTVNRDRALVAAFYVWAILKGLVSENPARRVPKYSELGREREIFLTPKQCRALIAAAEPAFKPMITFALLTGMRRGAILALQWRSVDFEHAVINIESATTKSGRKRVIPMCERVADILQDFWTTKKVIKPDRSDRVFSSWLGQRFTGKTIERMMNEAVERCTELPDDMREGNRNQSLTFHGLRHTAASQMVASGMSLFEVSRILGHSSTTTTERYAHFAPERATAARGALRKMGSALDAPGSIELKSGTEGKTG